MIRTTAYLLMCILALSLASPPVSAQQRPGGAGAATGPGSRRPTSRPASPAALKPSALTVAVLDFHSTAPGSPELGQQIAEVLTANLSGRPGLTLVDRSSLQRTLQEQELNLSGVVSADQATKVGKLVGARLLVTGKAFALDKSVIISAKVIGTETSLVDALVVRGDKDADVAALVVQLSEALSTRLSEAGPRLVAAEETAADPLPALKQSLSGLKLPKVAVRVPERHVTGAAGRSAGIDPAVETELKQVLTETGFSVVEGDDKDLAREGVELVITGEAFSEFAARIGNLVSCTDRVEVKVTRLKDGHVLFADKDNNRAVDLSENLAAKQALQKSGRLLGLRIVSRLAETAPKRE
jgi:TolB-like protein